MQERAYNKKIQALQFQLWKAKAELKSKVRQNKTLINMKYSPELEENNLNISENQLIQASPLPQP